MRSIHEMMRLNGKVALVTGGMGWLGSAITETLLELGATVVCVSRGQSEKFSLSAELDTSRFHEITFNLNVADYLLEQKIQELLNLIKDQHEKFPSILVNNMCVWPKHVDFMTANIVDVSRSLTSNVIPHLCLMQYVAQHMSSGDSIINIASMYGQVAPDFKMYKESGMGNALEYGAAKAALIQSTRYLASLLGPRGIRVNSISPGPFSRAGAFVDKEWFHDELIKRTMLSRIGQRDEIKGTITLLATDLGSYITGEDIAIDGGWTKL